MEHYESIEAVYLKQNKTTHQTKIKNQAEDAESLPRICKDMVESKKKK